MRALRADKMTYAALEATLEEHAAGRAADSIPVVRMIALTADAIGRRAHALAERLADAGIRAEVVDGFSTIGGGSAPGTRLPTRLVAIALPGRLRLESALRGCSDRQSSRESRTSASLLDLRTVAPDERRAPRLRSSAASAAADQQAAGWSAVEGLRKSLKSNRARGR